MAKYRAHILFGLIMTAYFLIRLIRTKFSDLPHFVRFHLTDLLFVPAMCLFALIVLRFLRRDSSITVPWYSVTIQVLLVSLYFEWYLPNHSPAGHLHVADLMDCGMYALGGVIFMLLQPLLSPERSNILRKKNGIRSTDPEM